MNYFMQLGGNCAYLSFISPDHRIRGPVDNVIMTSVNGIKLLLENSFYSFISSSRFTQKDRPASAQAAIADGDYPYFSIFPNDTVCFVHHNPTDKKFLTNLEERCQTFNKFYNKVKTQNNHFFIITINQRMVDLDTHELKGTVLLDILKYLQENNLLDKTIFVGTHALSKKYANWDYYLTADNKQKLMSMLGAEFKYIEVDNIDLKNPAANELQFSQLTDKLLIKNIV